MSRFQKVRSAGLDYVPPMWRGVDTRDEDGGRLAKIRTASLEHEKMWRVLDARIDSDGGRHPPVFLVPGDRDLVGVEDAARVMGKTEAEVARLAELGFLYSRHEDGGLKVEPAIVSEETES